MNFNLSKLPLLSTKRLEALNSMGIFTFMDLLYTFPNRYIDRSNIQFIKNLSGSGEEVTISGKIIKSEEVGFGKKKRLEVSLSDGTGIIKGIWFRGGNYIKRSLQPGSIVAFFGQVKQYGHSMNIAHPDISSISNEGDLNDFSRLIPIYPANKEFSKTRITSSLIQQWITLILKEVKTEEFIPHYILNELKLPELKLALTWIHNPNSHQEYKRAIDRFKFEELFLFELSIAKIKYSISKSNKGHVLTHFKPNTSIFFNEKLPFQLTDGQKSALSEIKHDLKSGLQMNRLIQGDVGSGKTIVAIGAMLMAIDNGFQAAFAAPTEILAEQHYHTLTHYLNDLNISVGLIIGGQKTNLRSQVLESIEKGTYDMIVGTHAIFQENVKFQNLGLAVIDEQHRFGVKQRANLLSKGNHPHLMVMSATPIPRSLAMTLYADLDISVIKGLPLGRKPIETIIKRDTQREEVFQFVNKNLYEGGQVYIIYPLVEESEVLDLKDATAGYEKIKQRFPDYTVGIIHGRMNTDEKEKTMRAFNDNKIQILVSTTVIEVGVDIPNASIMIIEHAERFGLSQLHQLRGRIGRGNRQSFCFLIPDVKVSKAGAYRLKTMVETNDGFRIAEADLKLRGPGDFLGTKQSGLPDFKTADIVEDQLILQQAKMYASKLMSIDLELLDIKHSKLRNIFLPYFEHKKEFYGLG